jgi:mannonate dehydratase
MYSLARTFTREAARRRDAAEPSAACRMPWRPDHGHRMMHDLDGEERDEGAVGGVTGGAAGGVVGGLGGAVGAARPPRKTNPGYTAIGRMRGMAEIRGLMHAVLRADAEARSRGANEGEEGGGGGGREAQAGTEGEGVRKRPRGEGSC